MDAGDLQAGDRLATRNGDVTVQSVKPEAGSQKVYNLDVEADHRYLVTEAGVLAHNALPCPAPGELLRSKPSWVKDAGSFIGWLKQINKGGGVPELTTAAETDAFVAECRNYGVSLVQDSPHSPPNPYTFDHFNIDPDGTNARVQIPVGYSNPSVTKRP